MEDRIFLLVKVTITTSHRDIHDALHELQSQTNMQLTSTENVKVLKHEIIQMKTKSLKS